MEQLSKPKEIPQYVWDGLTEAGQYYLARGIQLRKEIEEKHDELIAIDDAAKFHFGVRQGRARLVQQGEIT